MRVADRRRTLQLHKKVLDVGEGKEAPLAGEGVDAQRELEALSVRALETFEHPKYLRDALENTKTAA